MLKFSVAIFEKWAQTKKYCEETFDRKIVKRALKDEIQETER